MNIKPGNQIKLNKKTWSFRFSISLDIWILDASSQRVSWSFETKGPFCCLVRCCLRPASVGGSVMMCTFVTFSEETPSIYHLITNINALSCFFFFLVLVWFHFLQMVNDLFEKVLVINNTPFVLGLRDLRQKNKTK